MAFVSPIPAKNRPAADGAPPLAVLILDDERFDRHRLARLCSGLDFPSEITNAKTLQEFGTHLEESNYGLILLDYALPDGTGLDALKMVQLCARNLNTPTIMISGQAAPLVAEEARTIGCNNFLSKDDLSADSFDTVIRHALRATLPAATLPASATDSTDIEALLSICALRCARDIKPMVSRLLRQMRDLRASQTDAQTDGLASIEQNCMSLWAYLIEMERQDGAVLLSELSADLRQNHTVPDAAETMAKRDRPPSPFSAPRH
ncbi:Response regulator receiver domain protein [Sulfitobacter noctilucae]|uniref:response regulator n=1 Tax=Sulfitobacter noctilucae TaxID=1342302 RepID=UPI00046ABD6F|nr:response regulator [Sulfitobacter noctilucae]KIN70900.1 Response regulator receiver domain protein [Sulfitobacter noctilucae]